MSSRGLADEETTWIVWENRYGGGPRFAQVVVDRRTEKFLFLDKEVAGLYTKRLDLSAIVECKGEDEARELVACRFEKLARELEAEAKDNQKLADAVRAGKEIDEWGKVKKA